MHAARVRRARGHARLVDDGPVPNPDPAWGPGVSRPHTAATGVLSGRAAGGRAVPQRVGPSRRRARHRLGARVLVEALTTAPALQTFDPGAQDIERQIHRVWSVYRENPRAHTRAAALSRKAGRNYPRHRAPLRVLVVEDDDNTRYALEHYFRHHGAMVTTAASGSDALDIVRQVTTDVIINDIVMPGMTGLDLIRAVRALPDQRERPTPAIAISAQALPSQRKEALEAGFDVFLVSPSTPAWSSLASARSATTRGRRRRPSSLLATTGLARGEAFLPQIETEGDPPAEAKLLVDGVKVNLDRPLGQTELRRNLLVAEPFRRCPRDLELSPRETTKITSTGRPCRDIAGMSGARDPTLTCPHILDMVDDEPKIHRPKHDTRDARPERRLEVVAIRFIRQQDYPGGGALGPQCADHPGSTSGRDVPAHENDIGSVCFTAARTSPPLLQGWSTTKSDSRANTATRPARPTGWPSARTRRIRGG